MSGIWILGGTILVLILAYITYGSWLAKQWGAEPDRETPAKALEDGKDYVPAKAPLLLGHHFSSIVSVGAIAGPIQAAVFGWVPVLLWIVLGGVFFGAAQDFAALFASARHKGQSLGQVMEENVGRRAKMCFTVLAWLTTVLMVAAFMDIVARNFTGIIPGGGETIQNAANGAVAMTSMLFIPLAVCFGFINRTGAPLAVTTVIGLLMLGGCVALGLFFPLCLPKTVWLAVISVYIFAASVAPVWVLLQPRDYLNSFLFYLMMAAAIVGIFVADTTVRLAPFTGWRVDGRTLFPFLFVTVSCGAVSGYHSLVGSGITSKQLRTEKDAKRVGYGAMLLECLLAVIALIAAGSLAKGGDIGGIGTPTQAFSNALVKFFSALGLGAHGEQLMKTLILLAISALGLTTLDTAVRLGRILFQELFKRESGTNRFFGNAGVATFFTVGAAALVGLVGYERVWDLFGACSQTLAFLAFLAAACWLKRLGKNQKMLYLPMLFMFAAALGALGLTFYDNLMALLAKADKSSLMTLGVQNALIAPVFALALVTAFDGVRALFGRQKP